MKYVKTAVVGLVLMFSGLANATLITNTYTSNTFMTISSVGHASGSPSLLEINGSLGNIVDINVTLLGLTHTFPEDLHIALVNFSVPHGVYLMANAGGGGDINNIDITFDDEASAALANNSQLFSGEFQVSQYGSTTGLLPAMFGPTLDNFDGISANGSWYLYVYDRSSGDGGSLQGWQLEITTSVEDVPAPATLTIFALGLLGLAARRFKKQ